MQFSRNLSLCNLILFSLILLNVVCCFNNIYKMLYFLLTGIWAYFPNNSFKTHGNYSPNSKETRCEKILSGTFCLVVAPEFQSLFHLMVYRAELAKTIEQKGMTWYHDFWYSFSLSSSLFFLGEKSKGEEDNQRLDFKSCLSARSVKTWLLGNIKSNVGGNYIGAPTMGNDCLVHF